MGEGEFVEDVAKVLCHRLLHIHLDILEHSF